MRIISFVNGNSGPSYHRCIVPLLLMEDVDVYITNNLLEEHFEKGCDVFMYNRVIPEHSLPTIKELQRKYGFKICVDIDDYWELDPHHIMRDEYEETEFAKRQVQQLKDADIVLTTHERLAKEVEPINSNVHICPNAIPRWGQFNIVKQRSEFVRLFWQGSITHQADIELLRAPLNVIGHLSKRIKMIMAGVMAESPEWYSMAETYTAKFKHQYKLIEGAHVKEYYNAYAEADICLIPLVNSVFNRHKSNLKVLEAANMGLPVICSQVHPYMDLPVMYCNNSSDWIKNIERLVKSSKRRNEAGLRLQEYCDIFFNFSKINNERKQILEYAAREHSNS